MRYALLLGLAAAVACGGDNDNPTPNEPEPEAPLAITAVSPEDGATGVDLISRVSATFNRAVDASTLTPAGFTLSAGGTVLATRVTWDAAGRTARLSGPLLPGTLYQAAVTETVTDAEGGALEEPALWIFTTRDWRQGTAAEDGVVGRTSSLAVDGSGVLHVTYFDETNGDLRYAACSAGADCVDLLQWTSVAVDETGEVGAGSSLAIETSGRLHVIYHDETNSSLRYATCAADCTEAGSWTPVTIDNDDDPGDGGSALVQAENGRLHATFHDTDEVAYATCAQACTSATNWTMVRIAQNGGTEDKPSLAVDATGRIHIAYYQAVAEDLRYATCSSSCGETTSWVSLIVDGNSGAVGVTASLDMDGGGGLHVAYYDADADDLRYATCAGSCTDVVNWTRTVVDSVGIVGGRSSLRVGDDGRLHVLYQNVFNVDLKYATCAAACDESASWSFATIDSQGQTGFNPSLVIDPDGALHATYWYFDTGDLRYIN